jgi:hypothetical protein
VLPASATIKKPAPATKPTMPTKSESRTGPLGTFVILTVIVLAVIAACTSIRGSSNSGADTTPATVGPTTTTAPRDPALVAWAARVEEPMAAVKRGLHSVSEAADYGSLVGLRAACMAFRDQVRDLKYAGLPAPDAALDAALRDGLDEYDTSAALCIQGAAEANESKMILSTRTMNSAKATMETVNARLSALA